MADAIPVSKVAAPVEQEPVSLEEALANIPEEFHEVAAEAVAKGARVAMIGGALAISA